MKKLVTPLVFLALATGANAAVIKNSTTGIGGADQTITFSVHSLAVQSAVTDQFADLGVTFVPYLYYSSQTGYANITGATVTNFHPGVFSFGLKFGQDVSAASFAMVSNSSSWNFKALLDGVAVDSFSATVNTASNNFFGFNDLVFDEIQIVSPVSDYMIIDNLSFIAAEVADVPEPASLALVGLGLLGMSSLRRKKRGMAMEEEVVGPAARSPRPRQWAANQAAGPGSPPTSFGLRDGAQGPLHGPVLPDHADDHVDGQDGDRRGGRQRGSRAAQSGYVSRTCADASSRRPSTVDKSPARPKATAREEPACWITPWSSWTP